METRYVSRLPTAVLATGLMLLAFLALACGLILDSVARGRREAKRMAYLAAGMQRRPELADELWQRVSSTSMPEPPDTRSSSVARS